ncbi:MAG: phosphatase PAP2 family protein [Hyphomicrobium sp.]|uniref:phosphatase PAP2 family protein n=1 Tax=Hyphomicrobium sp. TaxID=82 RepID=UPI0039E6E9CD
MRADPTLAARNLRIWNDFSRTLVAGFKAHALVLAIAAIYFLLMALTIWTRPDAITVPFFAVVGSIFQISVLLTLIAIVLQRFYHMVIHAKPERPGMYFMADLAARLFDPRRWATGFPMGVAMLAFMYVYAIFKYNIPLIAPFSWDQTFEVWGRMLHFGLHPWQWLAPLLGNPTVTSLLCANYVLWGALLWGTTVALGFSGKNNVLRTRFFLTFMLTWSIGGSLLAIAFSSAGPCFWQSLNLPGNPYGGVMENLHASNNVFTRAVLLTQDTLWQGYSNHALIAGISAMPSMHNATALLLALTGLHFGRVIAITMWTHCILVFIGSIWLGWHYAVDGYVAFALTGLFWRVSLPAARWWHSLDFVKDFDRVLEELPALDSAPTAKPTTQQPVAA